MIQYRVSPKRLPPELAWLWKFLPHDHGRWFVAGGAVRAIIDRGKISDIDLFATHRLVESIEFGLPQPDIKLQTSDIAPLLRANGCRIVFTCPEGLLQTWKHRNGLKIQLILEVMGTPRSVISQFDFTACQFAMIDPYSLITPSSTNVWDAARKRLKIAQVSFPNATLRRVDKYIRHGYKLESSEMHNLITKCVQIPFDEQTWRRYID